MSNNFILYTSRDHMEGRFIDCKEANDITDATSFFLHQTIYSMMNKYSIIKVSSFVFRIKEHHKMVHCIKYGLTMNCN